jgi:hypothetical protein
MVGKLGFGALRSLRSLRVATRRDEKIVITPTRCDDAYLGSRLPSNPRLMISVSQPFCFCRMVGELGFEPRQTAPEAVVLPLHHSPLNRNNYSINSRDMHGDYFRMRAYISLRSFKLSCLTNSFSWPISVIRILAWVTSFIRFMDDNDTGDCFLRAYFLRAWAEI